MIIVRSDSLQRLTRDLLLLDYHYHLTPIFSGVYDTVKRNRGGGRVVNAHAGKSALDGDTYFNKRAEMYLDFKKWLQDDGGCLPPEEMSWSY